jgi:hypothetical protein
VSKANNDHPAPLSTHAPLTDKNACATDFGSMALIQTPLQQRRPPATAIAAAGQAAADQSVAQFQPQWQQQQEEGCGCRWFVAQLRWALDACGAVSQAFPCYTLCISTEIYLCHACSHHEIEDGNARAGPMRGGPMRPPPLAARPECAVAASGGMPTRGAAGWGGGGGAVDAAGDRGGRDGAGSARDGSARRQPRGGGGARAGAAGRGGEPGVSI